MLALVALGMMNLQAQQDVTKYYLTNYGFDTGFNYTAGQTIGTLNGLGDGIRLLSGTDATGWNLHHQCSNL